MLNKNIKLIVNYVVGPVIMLFLFYTVVTQLQKQPDWRGTIRRMLEAAKGEQSWKLFSMIALMCVNWGLESFKWKIALRPVQEIRFIQAFKAILAGACISSFTPNRVGDYLGRMFFVKDGNKVNSIAPTILCSISQMFVTMAAGAIGIFLFSLLPYHYDVSWINPAFFRTSVVITSIAALFMILIYFGFDPLLKRTNNWLRNNKKDISIPEDFSRSALSSILAISILRYGVFILQYYLLFSLFGIPITGTQVFTGVSVMFVLMALIPTLTFLTDLGFRWAAGLQIFQVFSSNTAGILAVSLGIWFINLIIPAFVGSLLILRIKLFRNK